MWKSDDSYGIIDFGWIQVEAFPDHLLTHESVIYLMKRYLFLLYII